MLLLVSEPLFACRHRSKISEVQYFMNDIIVMYFLGHTGQTKSSRETSLGSDEA